MGAFRVSAALAVALAAGPAAAQAASVSAVRATLTYEAAPGEANRVTILRTPSGFRIFDLGAPVAVGVGCDSIGPNAAECAARAIRRVVVSAGDGDDVVTTAVTIETQVMGGPGNDRLEGGEWEDELAGGDGDDVLLGGENGDLLDGGPGADRMLGGGESPDEFGFDAVVYDGRTQPVRLSLDGVANDGEVGEGDDIGADVEILVGGSGDDVLRGNDGALNGFVGGAGDDVVIGEGGDIDVMFGEGGADVLLGGPGTDAIFGGVGNDAISGGAGGDLIQAGNGNDRVRGGGGGDLLRAGLGNDALSGGAGADAFYARDGMRDAVLGGPGRDRAMVDGRDVVAGVERTRRPGARAAAPGLTGRPIPETGSPRARVLRVAQRLSAASRTPS